LYDRDILKIIVDHETLSMENSTICICLLQIYIIKLYLPGNSYFYQTHSRVRRGCDHMVVGFITTYMQSVHITINIMSSNPARARCTWYNIMW